MKKEIKKILNEFVRGDVNFMYHVTIKKNIDSILTNGLKINQPIYMTVGGVWSHKFYGCNPIFLSVKPNKTKKQNLVEVGDVILEVDIRNLNLVADLPSLVDHGATIEYGFNSLYWDEDYEPMKLRKYLTNGELYFDDLLTPNTQLIYDTIKVTGSAAVIENIEPKYIKLYG